jgi:hypothetical protein
MHRCRYCGGYGNHVSTCDYYDQGGVGIDLADGDLVENLGDGIGIDLDTGQVEMEIAPGFDIPL